MKKFNSILILGFFLSLAFNSASAQFNLFSSSENIQNYPPPKQCPNPTNQNKDPAFCQCFIEQCVIGCNYAKDGAFYCNETFIKSKLALIGNNDNSILKFCRKYKDYFPKDGNYDETVCLDHVKFYKNRC